MSGSSTTRSFPANLPLSRLLGNKILPAFDNCKTWATEETESSKWTCDPISKAFIPLNVSPLIPSSDDFFDLIQTSALLIQGYCFSSQAKVISLILPNLFANTWPILFISVGYWGS